MAATRALDAAPIVLAVETACRVQSAAVLRGEVLLAEERGNPGRTGAESLLPAVDRALRRAGLPLPAVEAFAVSIGPGSFTGLRVGVATVKGLAYGTGRPVAPVSTLAALAHGAAGAEETVAALLDARRGELYAAVFRLEGEARVPRPLTPAPGVYTPEELAALLPASCLLVGEGAALCGERIRKRLGDGVRLGSSEDPAARHVGMLGCRMLARGQGVDAAELRPHYVRRAEAEVKRTGQRFE